MNANLEYSLKNIDTIYSAFTHDGESMSKIEVMAILGYGIAMGYEYTHEISDSEINIVLGNIRSKERQGKIKNILDE